MDKANEALSSALGTLLRPTPTQEWLASTGPKLDRFKLQQSIENAITALNPDADEAAEILDALTASLARRYEDHADDALHAAKEFRLSLGEVSEPGDWAPDEMTLAKEAAEREAGR